jgi:FkbM family methyltransferase
VASSLDVNHPYHERSHVRATCLPGWRHLRTWIGRPDYRRLFRFARALRRLPRFTDGAVDVAGREIRFVDAPSFLSAWDEIFVNRIYDIGECGYPPRLIDVGANIGLAALYWKQRYDRFTYLGFEPDPDIAAVCRRNLAAWEVGGELIECAVTGAGTSVSFERDHADGGRVAPGGGGPSGLTVAARRLSQYLDDPVDLLKIDIEGSEREVLEEIAAKLGRVRRVFVEVHSRSGAPQPTAAVLAVLQTAGFRCYLHQIGGPDRAFAVIPAPDGDYDQLLNVYAVRL